MEKYYSYLVIIVVMAAFAIGYAIVSFIMKKITELNNLPKLNEELQKKQLKAAEEIKPTKEME